MATSSLSPASTADDGRAVAAIAAQTPPTIAEAMLRNLVRCGDVITGFRHIDFALSGIFREDTEAAQGERTSTAARPSSFCRQGAPAPAGCSCSGCGAAAVEEDAAEDPAAAVVLGFVTISIDVSSSTSNGTP